MFQFRRRPAFVPSMRNVCAALLFLLSSCWAFAQIAPYPAKPLTLVVPFPAGGITDNVARIVATNLAKRLGQPVVIDNRAGAGGSIAAEYVARIAPDGYVLLVGTTGMFGANLVLYKDIRYDPLKDFVGVHAFLGSANVLVANPSRPYKSITELITYAKANPGKVNYGSAGVGTATHLAAVLFQQITGTELTHVPYKGSAPALTDLVGGTIDIMFDYPNTTEQFVKSGKLNALAVMDSERVSTLPNVPTTAEAGVRGAESVGWAGIFAPSKTPASVVRLLSNELAKVVSDPEYIRSVTKLGAMPLDMGASKFQSYVNDESVRWRDITLRSGAVPQ